MNIFITSPLIVLVALVVVWIVASWKINRVSSPPYHVISKKKEYEIRAYNPYIIAETIVEGDREVAMRAGFRILAAYIFGDNTGRVKLDMTAPVAESESAPVKLAMTAPVIVRDNSQTSHVISFVMPRDYTLATLPKPTDSRIVFNTMPAHTMAVRKFSWYAGASRTQKQKNILSAALTRDGIIREGGISYAGYSAPFTIPFMEKHEVMVRIQR